MTWGRWEHLKDQGLLLLSYHNSEREDVMVIERLTEHELTLASHDISLIKSISGEFNKETVRRAYELLSCSAKASPSYWCKAASGRYL